MSIRERLIRWLRVVEHEDRLADLKIMKDLNDQIIKLIEQDERIHKYCILSQYKIELILKHGCLDCFSVDGEWHKEDCKSTLARDEDGNLQLVRRNNGRQPVGHS